MTILGRALAVGGLTMVAMTTAAGELELLPLGDPALAFEIGAVQPGTVVDGRSGEVLDLDGVVARLEGARVVVVGEEHTAMEQKELHGELLDALAAAGRRVVLGLEFFLRSHDGVLARWSRGEIGEEELLEATDWYGRGSFRFEYYRPVLEAARRHGVQVVGLNVPREIPRAVNRGGLGSLDEDQRAAVGPVEVDGSPQHRYLVSRYFGETVAMLPPGWFDNMYAAQCLWDVVMARSILAALPDDGTVLAIAGSGHVAYGLGIPARIAAEREAAGLPPVQVVTFCPVTAPPPDPDGDPLGHPMGDAMGGGVPAVKPARFTRSLADLVGGFAPTGGVEPFPRLGVQLADDDGPVVAMAFPDTPAGAAGLEHGDRVVDVDGWPPDDLPALRRRLSRLEWGARVDLRVERDDAVLDVAMLLYPDLVEAERAVAPGYEVVAAASFEPSSAEPAGPAGPAGDEDAVNAVLVRSDERPLRVEVRSRDRLDEVHELDAAGLAVRSLYRVPREDGAVEVRYERGADGAVVATTRLDRTGAVVGG